MVVGQLEIQMAANLARLATDMADANRMVGDAMKSIQGAVDLAKKAFVALTGITSIAMFEGMVKSAIEGAAALQHLSEETGASVEALSGLASVGKLTGTGADTIAAAMNKLAKNMSGVDENGKGAAQALRAIGIDFDDFRKLSPDQQMVEVAKAMDQFADGSGKSATAMALFGKTGAELLPFLKDLAATGELHAKVTAEQAEQAEQFEQALKKVQASGEAWKKELSMGMLPALNEAAQAFLGVMNDSGGVREEIRKLAADGSIAEWTRMAIIGVTYVADAFVYVWRTVKTFAESLGAAAAGIGISFTSMGEAASKAAHGDFKGAWDALQSGGRQAQTVIDSFKKSAVDTFSEQTFGQKIRDRMADLKGHTAALAENKTQIDFNAAAMDKKNKAAEEEAKKYAELKATIEGRITQLDQEQGGTVKLTEAQKMLADIQAKIESGALTLTDAHYKEIAALLNKENVKERQLELDKQLLKAQQDAAALSDKFTKQQWDEADKIRQTVVAEQDHNQKLQDEISLLGLSGDALTKAKQAIVDRDAAVLESTANDLEWQAANEGGNAALEEQARLLRQRADLMKDGALLEAQKAYKEEWVKTNEQIGQSLTDAIMNGGKSALDYIRDYARTLILRPIIQAVMQPVAGMINGGVQGLLGAFGMGSGPGGTSGAMSGVSNLSGMSSLVGGMSSLVSGIGSLTGSSSIGAFGAGMGLTEEQAAAAAAAYSEAGMATEAGAITAGSSAAAVIPVIGWVVAALGAVYALVKGSKKPSIGGYAYGSGSGGQFSQSDWMNINFGNNTSKDHNSTLQTYISQLYSGIEQTARGLGGSSGSLNIGAYTDSDRTQKTSALLGFFNAGGTDLLAGVQTGSGVFGAGGPGPNNAASKIASADIGKWFSDEMPVAIVQGLQMSNLPQRFKDFFGSVGDATLTPEKAQAMLATATAVKQLDDAMSPLGGVFAKLGDLSVEATGKLIGMTGGLDSFLQKAQGFVQNYYSTDEQNAIMAKQVAGALGGVGIDVKSLSSKAQYRSLVDSLGSSITTDTSQAQLAALLNEQDAFAKLADYLQQSGTTLGDLASKAPATAMLDSLDAQTAAAQSASTGIETLNSSVTAMSDRLGTTLDGMKSSLESGLAATVAATKSVAQQLRYWDNGDSMATSSP